MRITEIFPGKLHVSHYIIFELSLFMRNSHTLFLSGVGSISGVGFIKDITQQTKMIKKNARSGEELLNYVYFDLGVSRLFS